MLHLATEGMQVGHCKTTEYTFTENGDLVAANEQSATPVTLEAAAENGYYIHFKDGYLSATAAGAGKLTLTDEKSRYWIFSAHEDGGFVVRQSGEINVQLIISPKYIIYITKRMTLVQHKWCNHTSVLIIYFFARCQ